MVSSWNPASCIRAGRKRNREVKEKESKEKNKIKCKFNEMKFNDFLEEKWNYFHSLLK